MKRILMPGAGHDFLRSRIPMNPVLLLLAMAALSGPVAHATEKIFPLPVARSALLENETVFAPFARQIAAEVERRLTTEAELPMRKMLLTIRVHSSLHAGDDDSALESVADLRALLPTGAEKEFAGLTTRAWIDARRATGAGPDQAVFREAFARSFEGALARLPRSTAMRAVLEGQLEKAKALTPEQLRADYDVLMSRLADRGACTLAEGDQLIRLRHRYADLMPLRGALVTALTKAVEDRPAN